jgi:hypothetical protein
METSSILVAFCGSIPECYDQHWGQLLLEPYADNIAWRVLTLVPRMMLELACGIGQLACYLADLLVDAVKIKTTCPGTGFYSCTTTLLLAIPFSPRTLMTYHCPAGKYGGSCRLAALPLRGACQARWPLGR